MAVKMDEMTEACSTHGVDEQCVQNFGRKNEGKSPLGRSRRRWEFNVKVDMNQIGREGGIHLAHFNAIFDLTNNFKC
jgi:hypothetical protein